MRFAPILLALSLFNSAVFASEIAITIEIPRLDVTEYHRPYVAVWIENEQSAAVANLVVWYDIGQANKKGEEWLKDMRQWWRRSGRELSFPVDSITGATRAVGQHKLVFTEGEAPFARLAEGNYRLVVEAARETGGRELIKIPFGWPAKKAEQHSTQGKSELGQIQLHITP